MDAAAHALGDEHRPATPVVAESEDATSHRVDALFEDDDGAPVCESVPAEVSTHSPAAENDSAESPARRGPGTAAERVSPPSRADALVAMAETVLVHGPAARDGGDRYQAVVVVDAAVLSNDGSGRCELEDGAAVAPETARRISCDSSIVAMALAGGGEPLNVGRSTQSIPRAIRRALRVRDGGCRFPGCTQRRFVDGHHIVHWARGGETSLQNLVLLCRFHHRAVHEGGFG